MFTPDYRNFEAVMQNKQPDRLPLYEHIISPQVMEEILDRRFMDLLSGGSDELNEYFRIYCNFFRDMTYDTVSFEICIGEFLPGQSALSGGVVEPEPPESPSSRNTTSIRPGHPDLSRCAWKALRVDKWNLTANPESVKWRKCKCLRRKGAAFADVAAGMGLSASRRGRVRESATPNGN